MATLIEKPTIIEAAGNKPKKIEEIFGRVNTGDTSISIARMTSPSGWVEPGQRPEFREMTFVLEGMLRVEGEDLGSGDKVLEVRPGQGVVTEPGEWVRYSTPEAQGAVYVAICLPAFSPDSVHRDPEQEDPE